MLRQSNPDCLCILKTKISNASGILSNLGFPDSVEVPAVGTRGGMILAWHRGFDFDLVVQNMHLISIIIFGDPSFQPWALSFIHSPYDPVRATEFWDELADVGYAFGGPWLILGDFNTVSGQHEKWTMV